MRRTNAIKILATATILSSSALQSAWAWEADEVAARFQALLSKQQITTRWSTVRQEGQSIVLEDVAFEMPGAFDPIPFGTLALEDVTESDTSYRIGHMGVESYDYSDDGVEIRLDGLAVDGLHLAKEGASDPFAEIAIYEHLSVGSFWASLGGPTPLIETADVLVENQQSDETIRFEGSAESFAVDFRPLTNGNAKAMNALSDLGYNRLTGRVQATGNWTAGDGRLTVSQYEVDIEDAGKMDFNFDVSGYTVEFNNAMREVQSVMNSDASEEEKRAQGMAMMGLLQQLTLHGASIRFDDASLTGKLLDYVAKQQGGSPEAVANQVKAFVPLMAGQYLGPDLTVSLTKAMSAYLDDPQNLEIRAAPEEPLPFALLMGVAMSSPEALAKQVGLQVLANQ